MAVEMEINNVRFIDPVPKKEVFKYILASEMGASILKKVDAFKTVYSNKTFDYMSCKTPVLMAIDGVSRQLVEEADSGIYIEPENAEEYDRHIRGYINNAERLQKEGNNGYEYAKKHFDRNVLARKYLDQIKEKVLSD